MLARSSKAVTYSSYILSDKTAHAFRPGRTTLTALPALPTSAFQAAIGLVRSGKQRPLDLRVTHPPPHAPRFGGLTLPGPLLSETSAPAPSGRSEVAAGRSCVDTVPRSPVGAASVSRTTIADKYGVVLLEDVQLDATAPDDFDWDAKPNPTRSVLSPAPRRSIGNGSGPSALRHHARATRPPPGVTVDKSAVGVPRSWRRRLHRACQDAYPSGLVRSLLPRCSAGRSGSSHVIEEARQFLRRLGRR
jgi:hypothetical protein